MGDRRADVVAALTGSYLFGALPGDVIAALADTASARWLPATAHSLRATETDLGLPFGTLTPLGEVRTACG